MNERSSGSDCTPRLPSRPISPCSTSTVARASSSARWSGVVVARKNGASVASLQLGTSSRVSTRRASTAVSTTAKPGHGRCQRDAGRLEEADVERGVVGDQHAAAGELEERGDARRRWSARRDTIESVMPVSTLTNGRDRHPRVDQRLELAEHLAAADLHRADLGDARRPGRGRRRWSRGRRRRTWWRAAARRARRGQLPSARACWASADVMGGTLGRGSDENAADALPGASVRLRTGDAAGRAGRRAGATRAPRSDARGCCVEPARQQVIGLAADLLGHAAARGRAGPAARHRPLRAGQAAPAGRRRPGRRARRATPNSAARRRRGRRADLAGAGGRGPRRARPPPRPTPSTSPWSPT